MFVKNLILGQGTTGAHFHIFKISAAKLLHTCYRYSTDQLQNPLYMLHTTLEVSKSSLCFECCKHIADRLQTKQFQTHRFSSSHVNEKPQKNLKEIPSPSAPKSCTHV